jgi:formamidopyrimidine-DNA glycosylase
MMAVMPELPEVETIARGLHDRLAGRVMECVHLGRGDIVHGEAVPLCAALRGCRIAQVTRAGKRLRIDLAPGANKTDGPYTLYVHLGMSGRLLAVDRAEPVEPHTHLRIVLRRSRLELRFCDPRRFGGVWLVNGNGTNGHDWVGRALPPAGADPLTLSAAELRHLLARRRQIKALLLDQRIIGGIGNIYADEVLHRASIHPLTLASDLDDATIRRLARALRRVLTDAIRAGGSSISDYRNADNAPGTYQQHHRVYDRQGRPCRRCGTLIERLTAAGRSTYVCSRCQVAGGLPSERV